MFRLNLQLFSLDAIAKEVIKGNYGNGDVRKTKLAKAGYDPAKVQAKVNEMLGVGSKPTTNTPAPKATPTPSPAAKTPPAASNAPATPEIKGVDSSLIETIGSKFEGSDELAKLEQNYIGYGQDYLDFASNTDIISSDVKAGMSTPYSNSYLQAQQLLQSKIEQGYAGTHKDGLNDLLNKFMNREDFEYDVDKDQMFQQALASAMGSGKTAMQDTMGQAAALTGGYGSTYATTAGNQAYNAFIEDAYNNLPEYYNMALAAYEAEGQQMLQQFNMLDSADSKEYEQWYNGINLESQNLQNMVTNEYNAWNANNTMYTNLADMQLAKNAQIGSNLYNAYSVTADMYTNKYAQETQTWMQSIDSAYKLGNLQSSDYWNTQNMDFQKDQANISQSNWEKTYAIELATAGAKVDNKGNVVVDKDETYKAPTKQIIEGAKVAKENGTLDQYLEMYPEYDVVAIDNYVNSPEAFTTWTSVSDGGWHIGKVDDNAVIKDTVTGKEYTGDQLYEYYLGQGMTKKEAREAVKKAQKLAGVQ